MYSAFNVFEGTLTENDLPNAVTISGTSYSRSGTGYGDTTNGIIFETPKWARYKAGVRTTQYCLISNGVVDQFDACYRIVFDYPDSSEFGSSNEYEAIVRRSGLCLWETISITTLTGSDPFPPDYGQLYYSPLFYDTDEWQIRMGDPGRPGDMPTVWQVYKYTDMSTPTTDPGYYSSGPMRVILVESAICP
jgi:hypothetical protein